jgi:hypothetical protein
LEENLVKKYQLWFLQRKQSKTPFFPIYEDFPLDLLSGGAFKLYVFLGKHINKSGECWVSVQTMANYFKKDSRTIDKWIHELVELKLIMRKEVGHKQVAHTFLLPYGKEDNNES